MSKKRLVRRAATILAGALVLAGCTQPNSAAQVQDVVKAKALVIVDGHGKERIRLDTHEFWPNGPSEAVIHLLGGGNRRH